jgi:hypothetical protein
MCRDTLKLKYLEIKVKITILKSRIHNTLSYFHLTKKIYDFDYTGILETELFQLRKTIASISEYQSHESSWHDITWMKRAETVLQLFLDESYESLQDGKLVLNVRVNRRNYLRFMKIDPGDEFQSTLYHIKLWNLYNEIRKTYMRNWWD